MGESKAGEFYEEQLKRLREWAAANPFTLDMGIHEQATHGWLATLAARDAEIERLRGLAHGCKADLAFVLSFLRGTEAEHYAIDASGEKGLGWYLEDAVRRTHAALSAPGEEVKP